MKQLAVRLAGAAAFGSIMSGLGLGVSSAIVLAVRRGSDDLTGDLLVGALLVLVPAALTTLGFAIVTAPSTAWCRQPIRRVLGLAASLGAAAELFTFTGGVFAAPIVASIARSRPGLALGAAFVLFGLVWGMAGVGVAAVLGKDARG